MAKIRACQEYEGYKYYTFWCVGCQEMHMFKTGKDSWWFNGDLDNPTVTNSIKTTSYWNEEKQLHEETICHLNITNGKLHYYNDCTTHGLSNQVVEMKEVKK